jgi:hypothetical protein
MASMEVVKIPLAMLLPIFVCPLSVMAVPLTAVYPGHALSIKDR